MGRIRLGLSQMRVGSQTYNSHTNSNNPIFLIDSHFEKYYTHRIRGNANMRLFHGVPSFVE